MTIKNTERTDIIADLAVARANLIKTSDGLTDEQAATRPTVSALCIGGIIKHVAAGEESWLRFIVDGPDNLSFDLPAGVSWAEIVAGTAHEYPQWMIEHPNRFVMGPGESLDSIIARYVRVAAHTEELIAALPDLSEKREMPTSPWNDGPNAPQSVRRILTHVIVETTQHTGHAELIRETLDNQ
jgi:uncharacterized damage-inducible protein DinB